MLVHHVVVVAVIMMPTKIMVAAIRVVIYATDVVVALVQVVVEVVAPPQSWS